MVMRQNIFFLIIEGRGSAVEILINQGHIVDISFDVYYVYA